MNAKLCKRLRKMARNMASPPGGTALPTRQLMVFQPHEAKAREQGNMRGITAVNGPQTFRGIYRWLKRNYIHA